MKKVFNINKKQFISSLLFGVGICGIDYTVGSSNGSLRKIGEGAIGIIGYYILLFVISSILCIFLYSKMNNYNKSK